MKDVAHHRKYVQKKVIKSAKKEYNGHNPEDLLVVPQATVIFGQPSATFAFSKRKKNY